MRRAKGWTCPRVTAGAKCGHHNPPRTRKCAKCSKARPIRHTVSRDSKALAIPYEKYVEINGGEFCGVCGRTRDQQPRGRRFDRDHDHDTDLPRGLLCRSCNRALVASRFGLKITIKWLLAAAAYLQRHADRVKGLNARPPRSL